MTYVRSTPLSRLDVPGAALRRRPVGATRRSPQAFSLIALWAGRVRQRRALALLDDRLLVDIGLTRDDRARECAKPFWKA